jgi:hypothetical protein
MWICLTRAGIDRTMTSAVAGSRQSASRTLPIVCWAQAWAGVPAVLVMPELVGRAGIIPSRYFPPMTTTLRTLFEQLGEAGFWAAVGQTLEGWTLGLGIAALIAIPLGMLIGSSACVYRGLRPVIEFLRPIHSVALIPLAILIYGTGLQSKVFLAAFAATWPPSTHRPARTSRTGSCPHAAPVARAGGARGRPAAPARPVDTKGAVRVRAPERARLPSHQERRRARDRRGADRTAPQGRAARRELSAHDEPSRAGSAAGASCAASVASERNAGSSAS